MKAMSIDNQMITLSGPGFLDQRAKYLVLKWLSAFSVGHLIVEDGEDIRHFGEDKTSASLTAHIVVHHPSAYRDVMLNGIVGSGEAYMRGTWTSPNLLSVIRLMCANMALFDKVNAGWSSLNKLIASFTHRLRANSKGNAKLNIAAHYDLGNDFFSLFLDKTMMYSSAIFPRADCSLQEASEYKLAHICERLSLCADDHLLEIGTGWGGMAIYAAQHYGCQVTTTTISKEQYDYTLNKVKALGLSSKITVLLDDYRDLLKGSDSAIKQYDKLVSIEMIEAVGREYYRDYFSICSRLLKPNGLMLLQGIMMPDQRYEKTKNTADFIQRYIFPGGKLPSINTISKHVTQYTDMQIVNLDDITLHYADTLAHWRKGFFAKIDQVKAMGFDDVFIRMWDFYLSYCEGGFRERVISTSQLLLAKPLARSLPPVNHEPV